MRQTVCKEIPRELLEFGAELGSGEFGAVVEGMVDSLYIYLDHFYWMTL